MAVAHLRADCVRANPTLQPTNLRIAISRALRRHAIAPSRFGRDAVNDPRFVFDLMQTDRQLRPGTAAKVREHLAKLEVGHA